MKIGSLRLPNSPRSRGLLAREPSPAGSPPARIEPSAARPNAISSSRRSCIGAYDRVHVTQEANVLRANLDLHAEPTEIELTAAHGHRSGGRDEVAGVVVGGLFGLEREVIEPDGHVADQRDRAEVASLDRQVALPAGD